MPPHSAIVPFLTITLFVLVSAAIVLAWNRSFRPVPWRVTIVLWLVCATYQGGTLFTADVDVPANLAFAAQPWQATGRPAAKANTGIVLTQIVPWTRIARDIVLDGELPLWNRMSASGTPLLANQQTAMYHPFTLLGVLLPLGKAFTLSACLRLFGVVLFTFILLRNWQIGTAGSIFGAIAYTFCTFHVVWLLFPLGLSTMMLPLCLVGVQELVSNPRVASFILLLTGLSTSVLGGHPESALWVWIVTALFAIYACATATKPIRSRAALLTIAAAAFVTSMLLTAFFWLPTIYALRETPRYGAMQSRDANPANHGLTLEWLLPLVAPNVLGTPVNSTYIPPRGFHPAVLNDYGEVSSGYAGLATLALALAAPLVARRRPIGIAMALMAFSFLTFAEAPVWRDLVRAIPLAGISIHQRLRIFWDLGVCIAAALTVDAAVESRRLRAIAIALVLGLMAFAALYGVRQLATVRDPIGTAQFMTPLVTTALLLIVLRRRRLLPFAAPVLVMADLAMATWRYNPPAAPADFYPITGAIKTLQRAAKPFRFVALGWSFLPDTPGYYGIEDVKTTDPIQNARYMRLMKGYLDVDLASYDLVLRDVSQPFLDYLNIRYLYVPPEHSLTGPNLVERYRGTDGAIFENMQALPRYFLVRRFSLQPDFDRAVWVSRQITDYRTEALVDHVPAKVARHAPQLGQPGLTTAGGQVRIIRYGHSETVLEVESVGWNLLVSSDVHWPGWRAYWNGERQPTVIVNGAFLGCFIPPGKGELILRYRPDSFVLAARMSGGTAICLILLGTAGWVRRFRSSSPS